MMNRRILERGAIAVFALLAGMSFYIFSRFTVDDAFISWRYGKNLVAHGIWGYNPTHFDLTQAYTNPIMAVLSIIPAMLGLDVVLFFKLLSMASLLLPYIYIKKRVANPQLFTVLYFALLALPATMIHAFAGLETFLFASLLGLLLIALLRDEIRAANLFAVALLFVRPEAWLLVGLLPAYIAYSTMKNARGYGIDWQQVRDLATLKPALQSFALLGGYFAAYALFHWQYFGYVLPNTFYIKSGKTLDWKLATEFCFFLLPVLLLARRHFMLFAFALLFYAPVIYSYATSDLQMNYAGRFAYPIFASVYLLLSYLAATEIEAMKRRVIVVVAIASLTIFGWQTSQMAGLLNLANYYPRMLEAHADLGKKIAAVHEQAGIDRFALSDAGMAAYHADITAFDNTGLASGLVAHAGATRATIAQYHPDLVVLRADVNGVVLSNDGKRNLLQWATDAGYQPICDVVLNPGYRLRLFAAKPMPDFYALCEQSKAANDVPDADYAAQHIPSPPWIFWHE